jgi:hypothetical protein
MANLMSFTRFLKSVAALYSVLVRKFSSIHVRLAVLTFGHSGAEQHGVELSNYYGRRVLN